MLRTAAARTVLAPAVRPAAGNAAASGQSTILPGHVPKFPRSFIESHTTSRLLHEARYTKILT